MFDFVGVLALVVLGVVFGWLALCARRAQKPLIKWGGLAVSGLLSLVFTLALFVALVGFYKLSVPPYHSVVADVKVARTPAQVARGERFAFFCARCHSPHETLPLAGQLFTGRGGPPFGTLAAPNLTPAGEINDWSDGEIIRAIREGVHKSGRPLVVMPSDAFHNLSDADVQSIVAYLRSQPAVEPNTPATKLNVLAALLVGAGVFTTAAQAPITQPIVAPIAGATPDYGKYLVSIMACRMCHGENLTGGNPGDENAGPNLALIVPAWSETGFVTTLRTGVDPAGHTLGDRMPWKAFSAFASDDDLRAMNAYLRGLTRIAPAPQ
jgi:cytochrome c553